MRRRRFLVAPLVLLAARATADNGYPPVEPGHALAFPRDHGAHPAFRIEWWYVTGWIVDAAGHDYGIQVTFFRHRPRVAESSESAFAPRQLLFAHAALADPAFGRLRHDQRAARTGFGLAEADEATTRVAIDDWSLALEDDVYRTHIGAREFTFDLKFASHQPILLNGEAGVSRKGPAPEQTSYYYSRPQLAVTGTVAIGATVKTVKGVAWLDHEWSSEPMAADAAGWDWAGINFDDGGALMALNMRDRAGGTFWGGATLRTADGRVRTFAGDAIRFTPRRTWRSPRTGIVYPVAMTLSVGGLELRIDPLLDDQELDARVSTGTLYWEGAVRASGPGGVGRGYLELTGYGAPLRW